jgi:azurin
MGAFLGSHPLQAQKPPAGFEKIDQNIVVSAIRTQMKYDVQSFTVKPGAKIKLTFRNPDELPHNLIICTPGASKGQDKGGELIKAVLALGAKGEELGWEPESHPRILHSSGMIQPGRETVIWFQAPGKEGKYPYVCTYPGHFTLMNGVMNVSKRAAVGIVRGKPRSDPFYTTPSMRQRPQVRRIFMPEAGPAAIAVAVNDELHYCWDAGECRLRYIWKGDFIDGWSVFMGNGNSLASIEGDVLLREEANPLANLLSQESAPPKFLGYSLTSGIPSFRWKISDFVIEETIKPTADGKALSRSFDIKSQKGKYPITLKFQSTDKLSVSGKSQVLKGPGRLTVTLTPRHDP